MMLPAAMTCRRNSPYRMEFARVGVSAYYFRVGTIIACRNIIVIPLVLGQRRRIVRPLIAPDANQNQLNNS
jgi:hypothetical protein